MKYLELSRSVGWCDAVAEIQSTEYIFKISSCSLKVKKSYRLWAI